MDSEGFQDGIPQDKVKGANGIGFGGVGVGDDLFEMIFGNMHCLKSFHEGTIFVHWFLGIF